MQDIFTLHKLLIARVENSDTPKEVLKSAELKKLYQQISSLPPDERGPFGKAVNELKQAIEAAVEKKERALGSESILPIDVTAPWDVNTADGDRPQLLPVELGSQHPLTVELDRVLAIFTRMGFSAVESRQLDSDWHMFGALNFPDDHPARDDYDTFRTEEGLLPPAHTSTMQHRILKEGKAKLKSDGQIASVSYGRVFRNEDLDATHEHTFYQVEGIYVSKTASLSNMLAVLGHFFETYYQQKLKIKTQPAYFPFVEPGLELAIEKPAIIGGKGGDWLEMLGCGMIHPNVLLAAGIDPKQYRGFAWGGGIERLVMLAHGIEDIRHFESGKLAFLRKFS